MIKRRKKTFFSGFKTALSKSSRYRKQFMANLVAAFCLGSALLIHLFNFIVVLDWKADQICAQYYSPLHGIIEDSHVVLVRSKANIPYDYDIQFKLQDDLRIYKQRVSRIKRFNVEKALSKNNQLKTYLYKPTLSAKQDTLICYSLTINGNNKFSFGSSLTRANNAFAPKDTFLHKLHIALCILTVFLFFAVVVAKIVAYFLFKKARKAFEKEMQELADL